MPAVHTSEFVLRLAAAEGDLGGPEAVEALALELRAELTDAGVTRVDQVRVGDSPAGARGLEILGVCAFIVSVVQTGEALTKVVAAIRRVVARFRQTQQAVRVTIGGIDVDLAGTDDAAARRIVEALLALPAVTTTGVRRALIVANAHYDDQKLAQLRSPGHDAEALGRVLGDPGIGGFNVELLMDADERTIRRRIAAFFADRDRDDLLLLHFACHGIKDSRGRLYLAARDTDLNALAASSVPASFVNDALDETQSRRVVLILDCCYSGAFARGSLARSGHEVQIADEFRTGSGRIVLTASSATEYAFEGVDLARADAKLSVFTSALVKGLETGAADLDADGEISIDELYDYTYRQVRESTPTQAPMKWSFGVEGSLVVARSVRPAALPQSILDDLASDRSILRLEGVRALERLLRADKPGLRTAALAALADLRDLDDSVQVRRAASTALAGSDPTDPPAMEHRRDDAGASIQPTPPSPDPMPVPQRVERVPPPGTTSPQLETGAAERPTRTLAIGHSDGLLIAASLLVVLSVLLGVVGLFGIADATFADIWYYNLIWVVQLAGAALALATRHTRWGGLLFGALAWAWVDLAAILHSSVQDLLQGAWGFLVTGDLIAIAAQVCAGIALVRARSAGHQVISTRVFSALLLAPLAVVTSLFLAPLLYDAWSLDISEGSALRVIAAIVCAAALPAALVGPLADRAALLVPVGWWFGGAEFAITISVNLSRDGISDDNRTKVIWLWILVNLTTAAFLTASRLLGRGTRRATSAH